MHSQGQAPFLCPFCHCSDGQGNGAAGFKQAAGPAKEVFPPRDAANHASDLAKFKVRKLEAPATTNSWNGVSAPTCLPKVDWGRLIPPYLHLILGTVNDEVQAIYSELLVLDKVDSASVDRMESLTAALADREDELIDHAEEVISACSAIGMPR